MAYVPELEDPKKDASTEDTSDLATQTNQSNITTSAPVTGGQTVAGGAAPQSKSSGTFQDFSKFKTANQGKLSALSNLATEQANKNINDTASAFNNVGSAYQTEVQGKAKNWDTSQYKNLNNDSKVDQTAIGNDLNEANAVVDTSGQQGKLAGSQEYTNLQNATNQVSNLGNRAGTASALADAAKASNSQSSAAAANQDALLLQSMGDYRSKANALAQANKGADVNALTTQQKAISDTGDKVQTNNKEYINKALDSLTGLQGNLQKDLTDRAATKTAEMQTSINKQAADAKASSIPVLRAQAKQNLNDYIQQASQNGAWINENTANEAAAKIKQLQSVLDSSDEDLYNSSANDDIKNAVNSFQNEGAASKVTADAIYRDDATRQQQLSALQKLLGKGNTYNAAVLDPAQSQALSPVQQLLANIQGTIHPEQSWAIGQTATQNQTFAPVDRPLTPAEEVAKLATANGTGGTKKAGTNTISKTTGTR